MKVLQIKSSAPLLHKIFSNIHVIYINMTSSIINNYSQTYSTGSPKDWHT